MNTKKVMPALLMQLLFVGMTISQPANADTLSDLRRTCAGCHGLIVQPSGWRLDGNPSGKTAPERSVADWLRTIDRMEGVGGGLPATTPKTVAAQFLYDKQYLIPPPAATTTPLTSIAVTPINRTIDISHQRQYAAQGTHSDGWVLSLRSGSPWDTRGFDVCWTRRIRYRSSERRSVCRGGHQRQWYRTNR